MAMKLICGSLLAVALLGCLADAQYPKQIPQQWPKQTLPQRPQQSPQRPQQSPQRPQQSPQRPQQFPQKPHQTSQHPDTFHTCEVSDNDKIQCGAAVISESDCISINCCFNGRMCYYGKAVTFQCTKDAQMIVVVAKDATLPNIDFDSVHFLEEDHSCDPVGITSAFAIYQFPVTACGTVIMEEPGVLIYENKMSSRVGYALGALGMITRDTHFELLMQCRYTATAVTAVVIDVGNLPAPFPVAGLGPLRVELRLANGQCAAKGCQEESIAYDSFYLDSDYPVTKVLRDPVYVEVRILERTDPNLVLTLGRCWVTSEPYPFSQNEWDLVIDGCPNSADNYRTTMLPMYATTEVQYLTHYKRFVFKMFTFVSNDNMQTVKTSGARPLIPLDGKMYIHCETAVCYPTLGYDCEPICSSRKRRDIVASGQGGSRDETIVVSSKEIIITNQGRSIQ